MCIGGTPDFFVFWHCLFLQHKQTHTYNRCVPVMQTLLGALPAKRTCNADEDKTRVGLTRPHKGVFSRVAGALSLSSSSAKQAADDSLADQWLDFLIQQADAADAAGTAAGVSKGDATTSARPGSALNFNLEANQYSPTRPLHDWNSMQGSKA